MPFAYQTLRSMPCRKPCNRYTNVDDVYEGAVPVYLENRMESYSYEPTVESFEGAYEPSVSRESYEYEPTVESYDKKNNQAKKQVNVVHIQKQNQAQMNQQNREKRINTVQACNCQCQPHFYVKESYMDPMESNTCDCGMMHRPYRMHQCGYNQSPSWESHRSNLPTQTMATVVQENMQPGMEKACGCEMVPYYNEQCGDYNQSQTWGDQRMFRENIQNKY
jgi:hypothetical protein